MRQQRLKQRLEFILFLALLAALWYFGRQYTPDKEILLSSLEKIPLLWRGLTYALLYVVVSFFLFFSKDVFWIVGALLFGAFWSTVFICFAEAINAVILFYLARRLGRAYTRNALKDRYRNLDERLGKVNFLWLFLFRVAPLIPYRFMDLAAGLTKISFRRYFLAVLLGSPLKMYWIQFILAGVGKTFLDNPSSVDPAVLVNYFLRNRHMLVLSMVYVVFVVLVFIKIRRSQNP